MLNALDQVAAILLLAANGPAVHREPMTVTAYTNHGSDNITASLHHTAHGVCACTDDYSFGQLFYVPRYGWVTCWDRGRLAEHGIDLDVWFPSRQEALNWGRREVDVLVVE